MEIDAQPAPTVFFRPAESSDLERIVGLEEASYPEDEKASPADLKLRLEDASDFFLTAVTLPPATDRATDTTAEDSHSKLQVIGYVCGTLSTSNTLSHESMSIHEPQGKLLCIHSVCVANEERRKGLGSRLLVAYVKFYESAGFSVVGPSPIVHGADQWIEMVLELPAEEV